MAIQPISRTDYVSHVSFGKSRKGEKSDGGGHMTTAAKAVPIVVLMSMSPLLTQCATAENYNKQVASYPTTEVVVQTPQEPKKEKILIYSQKAYEKHNGIAEIMQVNGYSKDDNPDDIEIFRFQLNKIILHTDNPEEVLAGQFLGVSDKPNSSGLYVMMYSPANENGRISGETKFATVPMMVAMLLHNAARKESRNNRAAGIYTLDKFKKKFGEDVIEKAPYIGDCTKVVSDK